MEYSSTKIMFLNQEHDHQLHCCIMFFRSKYRRFLQSDPIRKKLTHELSSTYSMQKAWAFHLQLFVLQIPKSSLFYSSKLTISISSSTQTQELGKTGGSLTCLHSQTRWGRTGVPFCSRFMCSQVKTAFKGKGKVAPLKKFMKTPRFHASFRYFFAFVLFRT